MVRIESKPLAVQRWVDGALHIIDRVLIVRPILGFDGYIISLVSVAFPFSMETCRSLFGSFESGPAIMLSSKAASYAHLVMGPAISRENMMGSVPAILTSPTLWRYRLSELSDYLDQSCSSYVGLIEYSAFIVPGGKTSASADQDVVTSTHSHTTRVSQ